MSESARVEIKESRLRQAPEVVAGSVLIAFAISEKRPGVGFDDGCDVRDLVIGAGPGTEAERRENLTVRTYRFINLTRRNSRRARLRPWVMVKLQGMRIGILHPRSSSLFRPLQPDIAGRGVEL